MPRITTPPRLQTHASECGSVCIGIVLEHSGHYHSNRQLRNACCVGRDGATIAQMRHGIEQLGYDIRISKKGLEALKNFNKPLIIHWNMHHFVVLEGFCSRYAHINDPAVGHYRVSLNAFKKRFSGICLEIICSKGHQKRPRLPFLQACHKSLATIGTQKIFFAGLMQGLLIPLIYLLLAFYFDFLIEFEQRSKAIILSLGAFALLLFYWLSSHYKNRFIAHAVHQFAHRLRLRFVKQIMQSNALNQGFYSDEVHATISAFTTHSQNSIRLYLKALLDLAPSLVTLVILLLTNGPMAAMAITPPLMYLFVVRTMSKNQRQALVDMGQNEGLASQQLIQNTNLFPHYFALGAGGYLLKNMLPHTLRVQKKSFEQNQQRLIGEALLKTLDTVQHPLLLLVALSQILFAQLSFGQAYLCVLTAQLLQHTLGDLAKNLIFYRESARNISHLDDFDDLENLNSEDENTASEMTLLTGLKAITIRDLSYQASPYHPWLIKNFRFEMEQGEWLCITGASGIGKSTLLALLSHQQQPTTGEIIYFGELMGPQNAHIRPGFVFSEPMPLIGSLTHLFSGNRQPTDDIDHIKQALAMVELAEKLDWFIHNPNDPIFASQVFSPSERHQLSIAKAWHFNSKLIFIDEAFGVVDEALAARIIKNLKQHGTTAILVSHRIDIQQQCEHTLHLTHNNQ